MKKKKINSIDIIVDKLTDNFSKIENFKILFESVEGKKLFDLVVKQSSEIHVFETLFLKYYIPASSKSVVDGLKEISNSKYKHLLNISKEDLKENVYETIRLGYVGLFHKYEAYLKALIEATNFLMREIYEDSKLLSIENYCKKEFGFNIFKSHDKFYITKRINYISNCVKHYDGYPKKEPVHVNFQNNNKNEKIIIDKETFKSDIEHLKLHNQLILSQITLLGFKQYIDFQYRDINGNSKLSQELRNKYEDLEEKFNFIFSDFLK